MNRKRKMRVVPFAEFRASTAEKAPESIQIAQPPRALPENAHPLLADVYRTMDALSQEMQKYSQANDAYSRILAEKDETIARQEQENEAFASLLAQREEELDEAYEMIDQLENLCEETNAKYRRLSAYLLKLELELRSLNRSSAQNQRPQRLAAPQGYATVDDLLCGAQQEDKGYVLEQRDNVIYRVKRKG